MAMRLSKTTWSVLDLLRVRLAVAIHVVDADLTPVSAESEWADRDILEDPVLRDRCRAVLTASELPESAQADPSLVVLPLRHGREMLGVVVVSATPRDHEPPSPLARANLQSAAQIARAAIETDLALSTELGQAAERARRLQGILRFLGVLAGQKNEEDVMQAVVQAATVWFDLDCRVYRRNADDSFGLFVALPGLDPHDLRERLDGARVRAAAAAGHLLTAAELDDFGRRGRRGEAIVVPIGPECEWAMLIAGTINQEVELTFAAIGHVLAARLQQSAAERSTRWRDRLIAHANEPQVAPERVLLGLLGELAGALDAGGASLALVGEAGRRTLASVGMTGPPDQQTTRAFDAGCGNEAVLELWTPTVPLPFAREAVLEAWIQAIEPWLRGTVLGLLTGAGTFDARIEAAIFERRIQDEVERAKRFNLGLGLVLVATETVPADQPREDALLRVVRPQLRASDVTGVVRGGMLAILLVHSGAEGADSVVGRLRQRFAAALQIQGLGVRIGHAVFSSACSSAEALLQQAMLRMGESDT